MTLAELALHRPKAPLRANRVSLRVNAAPDRLVLAGEGAG